MLSVPLFSRVSLVRERAPLVHCLANQVSANFTANALLALGAAPAMIVAPEEVEEFASVANALSVNLGTLDEPQMDTIRRAVAGANARETPWVLDPVAVGVLSLRTGFAHRLLRARPAAIRGNASEIISLAGGAASGRGVDSAAPAQAALPAARALAKAAQCVVAVSGATDYVTDGARTVALSNGSALMARVSGAGCILSAVVAAFVGTRVGTCVGAHDKAADHFEATITAMAFVSIAGELAARDAAAPGSFAVAFLDRIATLDAASFGAMLRLQALDPA